jgi:hypothetical protein
MAAPTVESSAYRSFDEPGLQAFGAHADFESRSVARVDSGALKIDQPTAARMPVRVTDRVPGDGAASAALADFCHRYSSSRSVFLILFDTAATESRPFLQASSRDEQEEFYHNFGRTQQQARLQNLPFHNARSRKYCRLYIDSVSE